VRFRGPPSCFRQLLAPKTRVTTATVVETSEEEIAVALSAPQAVAVAGAPALMNFDDKLQVARTAVSTDAKRVAQVVRDWVESDG